MMIRVTLLSGPFAGETRVMPHGTNPRDFFATLLGCGYEWRVDYSQATEEEVFLWFREDLVARCIRALKAGLPVKFMEQEFYGLDQAGDLEDVIVNSRRMVTLARDDEEGVEIVVGGWEH